MYVPRRNLDSPTPSPASECAPPPGTGGGGHTRLRVGSSQFRRPEKKPSALSTLCRYLTSGTGTVTVSIKHCLVL